LLSPETEYFACPQIEDNCAVFNDACVIAAGEESFERTGQSL